MVGKVVTVSARGWLLYVMGGAFGGQNASSRDGEGSYSVQLGDDVLDISSCMVAEQEQNSDSSAMKLQ
jgi:hypothetical protein